MSDPDGDPDAGYYRKQITRLEAHVYTLEAELGTVRGKLDDRTSQLVRLRGELDTLHWAERLALKNAARPVPAELQWAIGGAETARWRSAWIPMGDGRQMLITIGGPAAAAEKEVWRYLEASHLKPVRGNAIGPFIRADLPRPLAAYVDEQAGNRPAIVLGTWLNGDAADAVRAIRLSWRAHRPGRRLYGFAFLPLLVALRGLRHLVPSQAAVPAAAGLTASAMPLISAAVISTPIITSLEVGERDFRRGPASARLTPIDSHSALTPPIGIIRKPPRRTPDERPSAEPFQREEPASLGQAAVAAELQQPPAAEPPAQAQATPADEPLPGCPAKQPAERPADPSPAAPPTSAGSPAPTQDPDPAAPAPSHEPPPAEEPVRSLDVSGDDLGLGDVLA